MNNLPANRDQLPAPTNQRVIPQVDNVLQEMMLAGQTDGLLEEVLLQLKTFYTLVWCATYGNDISVGVTVHSVDMEAYGKMWRQPARDPELDIRMSIRQFEDGRALNELLLKAIHNETNPVVMSLESGVEMMHYDGSGIVNINLTIPGGYPYGDRWHKLILVMFNATEEMKAKVDYITSLKPERKTDLEEALYQTCRALSAFYEWQMLTNSPYWRRDPYSQPPQKDQEQISYEPRLGRF